METEWEAHSQGLVGYTEESTLSHDSSKTTTGFVIDSYLFLQRRRVLMARVCKCVPMCACVCAYLCVCVWCVCVHMCVCMCGCVWGGVSIHTTVHLTTEDNNEKSVISFYLYTDSS